MLIVNLTTTFQRLSLCRVALTSLLLQSRLPDQINLWVSKEPYLRDKGIGNSEVVDQLLDSLPEGGRNLVNIRWVPNSGPYRKLIPMLREAGADDVIVTADDDIFYGENWLCKLLGAYDPAENFIVAGRVRQKKYSLFGKKTSYIYWSLVTKPSILVENFVVTFGGGAVLSREHFIEEDLFDDSFMHIAPTADDLWYTKMLVRNNVKVRVVPEVLDELIFFIHSEGLGEQNNPLATTLIKKIKFRFWDKPAGAMGLPVCINDKVCKSIESHFS